MSSLESQVFIYETERLHFRGLSSGDIDGPYINWFNDKGIPPVAERLHYVTFLGFAMCLNDLSDDYVDLIISSFRKVWMNFDSLRNRNCDVAVVVGR